MMLTESVPLHHDRASASALRDAGRNPLLGRSPYEIFPQPPFAGSRSFRVNPYAGRYPSSSLPIRKEVVFGRSVVAL